jgi:UDP-glucose 4-epimerase
MILITGGTGYIGSQTIIQLIRNGYDVISIDDYRNSNPNVLNKIKEITGKEVLNYPFDLTRYKDVKTIFEDHKIDSVIHFGADKSVDESVKDPIKYFYNNVNGLTTILKLCEEYGVKKFIFSSSASVYGNVDLCPIREDSSLYPVSPYGFSKKMGEDILNNVNNIDTISLRYFNPVGSDETNLIGEDNVDPKNLVPIMCEVARGKRKELLVYGNDYNTKDGTCVRDYIHVMDLANAHIKALKYKGSNTFNIGTGSGYSVLEMIKTFEEVNSVKLNYKIVGRRKGDVPKIFSETSKMESKLKFKCEYGLEDMLKSAWQWELKKIKEGNDIFSK